MTRLAALLLLLASPAVAESARVISGEHADFTRLVVELPQTADWTVGRTAMGYAFATSASSQPGYDLSKVWDRIPRTRLQALRADPETGALQLTLACACHVFPFEYRPGMVVIDIKEGPAPPGSSFEAAFTGAVGSGDARTALAAPPVTAPKAYDWLDGTRRPALAAALEMAPLPLPTGSTSLDPLRDELLEQISRGATQGVVDMVLPGPPPDVPPSDAETLPWSQITIGAVPGVSIREEDGTRNLTAEGEACIADEMVDLPAWGADQPPLELLAKARTGLFGEFDRVETESVMQSVRLHLYLGFGVEAAQTAAFLEGSEDPETLKIYLSMARLIDGESDPATPFAGMLDCNGAAALWAALSYDRLPAGPGINSDAIVRSFVKLPAHLRLGLGPPLAERLLQRGDEEAARIIRDAIQRSPGSTVADVALLDAKAELHADRPDAAIDHAETSVAEGVQNPDSLITLVEAHFQDLKPVGPEVAEALLSFQREQETGETALEMQRATILALALSDQTAAAFDLAETTGEDLTDLWQIAQSRASDDDFLRKAVLADGQTAPTSKGEVVLSVATRLVDLGFGDAALAWLGPIAANDTDQRRRVAARAELLRGNARSALDLLSELTAPEDETLRAKALVQLGNLAPARLAYAAAGLPDEAARLLPWEANWPEVETDGSEPWADAAATATVPVPDEAGPLARGAALVEESASARAALDALLSSVPSPSP